MNCRADLAGPPTNMLRNVLHYALNSYITGAGIRGIEYRLVLHYQVGVKRTILEAPTLSKKVEYGAQLQTRGLPEVPSSLTELGIQDTMPPTLSACKHAL